MVRSLTSYSFSSSSPLLFLRRLFMVGLSGTSLSFVAPVERGKNILENVFKYSLVTQTHHLQSTNLSYHPKIVIN